MPSFSIIICTYNPDPVIFKRLLNAVLKFEKTSPEHEVIIIDNNSSPFLSNRNYVNSFIEQKPNSYLFVEPKSGLTSARIAGIKASKNDWVIFFDDDNEPEHDYLVNTRSFLERNSNIGICGPGKVDIEFMKSNSFTKTTRIRKLFQYKYSEVDLIESDIFSGNPDAFPYGTGMVIRKNVLNEYCDNVAKGVFTLTDRAGNSLSSGGDTQILYLVLKMGYYSGTSFNIKLRHIISNKKTNRISLLKLFFSINVNHLKAFNEVFPENAYPVKNISNTDCIKAIFYKIISDIKQNVAFDEILFNISELLGMKKANIVAGNCKNIFVLKLWEYYLGI